MDKLDSPVYNYLMTTKAAPQSPRSPEIQRQKVKLMCLVFGILNVLLSILIMLTAIYLCKDNNLQIQHTAGFCVECSDLQLHPDDGLTGVTKTDDGNQCCAGDNQEIYSLVKMYAAKWMKKRLATANPKYSKYSCGSGKENSTIKVVGRPDKQAHAHHRKVLWNDNHDLAIIPENKHLTHHPDHGFIEIKQRGLYFVYSQLVLEHTGPGAVESFKEGPVNYQHSIQLIKSIGSQSDSVPIISNKDTRCSCTKDKYRFTSHIGSAFQLLAGDKLFVKVNNVTEVVPSPHMNHFGVHKL